MEPFPLFEEDSSAPPSPLPEQPSTPVPIPSRRYYASFSENELSTTPPSPIGRRGTITPSHPRGRPLDMAASAPSRGGVSPSSSPRLPSPPPYTEIQLGPKSPTVGDAHIDFQLTDSTQPDEGAARRVRRGARAAEMAEGPPLVELEHLESPFQLQEYLKALHIKLTRSPVSARHTVPLDKDSALMIAQPPKTSDGEAVDKNLWLYELCRFFTMKTNSLVIAFHNDNPPCSAETCPEMRASEWQYLCAVHDPPKSCAAIDYCCHTLDWAANILTSPKHFPSRLSMGGAGGDPNSPPNPNSMRQLVNIFRRVYRIYAHAWFQHREVFWTVEGKHGLYVFFKTVCDVYDLIPSENFTIPPEAECTREEAEAIATAQARAEVAAAAAQASENAAVPEIEDEEQTETPIQARSSGINELGQVSILRREPNQTSLATSSPHPDAPQQTPAETSTAVLVSTAATTRRHRSSPSTGSQVTTIQEGEEEDDEDSGPGPATEEGVQEAGVSLEKLSIGDEKEDTFVVAAAAEGDAGNQEEIKPPEDPTPTHEVSDPFESVETVENSDAGGEKGKEDEEK